MNVAAQLHRQELWARVEPDEELAPLAVDSLGDTVAERQRRQRRAGPGLHLLSH
jgi:hypothetical protein